MANDSKSFSIAAELKDNISRRLPALACSLSVATDGAPLISIGAGTAGSQSAVIKVVARDMLGTDAVGNTPASVGPHSCQVVLETSSIANVALMLESNKLEMLGACALTGCVVELYMVANTTAPSAAGIAAGNLKDTFYTNVLYKLNSAM